jgi:PIN domain nuclease of toxin-antitoxin system
MEAKTQSQAQTKVAESSTIPGDNLASIDDHGTESVVTLTNCPTEPCAIFYTDAISQSILVICKDARHTNTQQTTKAATVGAQREK